MKELMEIKALLKSDELLYLETYNKITGWVGCASFYTNGKANTSAYNPEPDGEFDPDGSSNISKWPLKSERLFL
jgi:hypothetical protein